MTIHQAKATRGQPAQWVELRAHGRMWGRYNPTTHVVEFARNELRVVFDLTQYKTRSLHKAKDGVEYKP